MSFPRYPSYKDSGVEWIGQVPKHWSLPKLKSVASFSGGGTPSRENLAYWNGDIPWVSPKDMKAERIVGAEESITEEGLRSSASNLLPPGRVLMVVRSGILKHTIPVAINETEVALNQDMKALNFDSSKCTAPFFLRWVQGHNDQLLLAWAKQGATVESIEHTYLADTVLPLPDIAEQTAIAAFLDRETGKIDQLVAEQRRLMELLKEKRQAVISHAVTRGLNAAAPLKPSGIEWLGDVPAHWRVLPMRMIANVVRGASPRPAGDPKYFGGEDVPWVTVAEITKDNAVYLTDTESFLTHEGAKHSNLFRSGTLIYSNSGATLGVPKILGIDACANDGVVAFSNLSAEVRHEFLYHYLSSITDYIREKVRQGSGQPNLNTEIVKDLRFGLPSLEEQDAIVQRITELTGKFDSLTSEAQRAIDLLQERRTALISAAVTGQIDVRDLGRAGGPLCAGVELPAVHLSQAASVAACTQAELRDNGVRPREAIELPGAALHPHAPLHDCIPGVVEMKRFWRSGDPADLPENPDVAVVVDWLNRIAGNGGFESALRMLGLEHQRVMDEVLQPAEEGNLKPLRGAHPLVLMQCLWRIGVQIERIGYDDMRRPVAAETFAATGEFWRVLRRKLIAGKDMPPLAFCPAPADVRRVAKQDP